MAALQRIAALNHVKVFFILSTIGYSFYKPIQELLLAFSLPIHVKKKTTEYQQCFDNQFNRQPESYPVLKIVIQLTEHLVMKQEKLEERFYRNFEFKNWVEWEEVERVVFFLFLTKSLFFFHDDHLGWY